MCGVRKEKYYTEKYGDEVGKEKYNKLLIQRQVRDTRRTLSGSTDDPDNFVICQGCNKKFKRITPSHLKNSCVESMTIAEYVAKYQTTEIVAPNLKKLCGCTEPGMIAKYGIDDGKIKWNQYRDMQAKTNTFEYKAEKYNFTKDKFDSYNKSRAVTLANLILKHGEKVGLDKWENYCERQRYTNTLEYFVEKYDEMDGIDRWEKYNIEKGKSSSLTYIMQKYCVDLNGAELILADRYSINFSSKNEKAFIEFIKGFLPDIQYTYETKQFCIWNHELNSPTFFDITSSTRMKIIEYNGDYWHANINTYSDDFLIKQSNRTASEVRIRDGIKIKAAKDRGFDVIIVWESEYLANPAKIKEQLINWW